MPNGLQDHPLRRALVEEVHARPFASLAAPEQVSYLAMLSGEAGAEADRAQVAALFERFGQAPPDPGAKHALADFGAFRLKWERHTEFSSYSFFVSAPQRDARFAEPAIRQVPQDWLEGLPGEVLAALHIELEAVGAEEPTAEQLAGYFSVDNFAGSIVASAAARVWIDFAMDAEGFGRALVQDRSLRPRQAGRLIQRLCEIETYRTMALLAFPLAQGAAPELSGAGRRLTEITGRMTGIEALAEERQLLDELTAVSAQIEKVAAATAYRFGAARAYYALARRRIEELREERLEGYQTLAEFMDRRLAPAMRTCESVDERLGILSERVARASQLLRTRVDIQLEAQNQEVLASMDRRARLQLRLQETVEGLSVVAISYYLVGLVSYLAKAGKSRGLPLDVDLISGLAVPVTIAIVWLGVRRLRRILARGGGQS